MFSCAGTNLLDVQFLVDASNCVISNKRILQWLYVYGHTHRGMSSRLKLDASMWFS